MKLLGVGEVASGVQGWAGPLFWVFDWDGPKGQERGLGPDQFQGSNPPSKIGHCFRTLVPPRLANGIRSAGKCHWGHPQVAPVLACLGLFSQTGMIVGTIIGLRL